MSRNLPSTPVPAEALGLALQRILGPPLSVLRASIEALAADLERHGQGAGPALDGALEQVVRLARDVETLVELAAPRSLTSLRCSIDEIAHLALKGLDVAERSRVRHARAEANGQVEVDGPLLARCLTWLLQGTLARSSDPALLSAHVDGEQAVFSIVGDGPLPHGLPQRIDPTQGREELACAVRTAAAERDLARMGAGLRVEPTSRGLTCIRVELPLIPRSRPTRRKSAR